MRLISALGGGIMLLVFTLPGCSRGLEQQLQGRWVGQSADNFSSAQAARALGWARGASFEFAGSRVTVKIPAERPRTGTFQVTELSEGEVQVSFLRPRGTEDHVTFRVEDEQRMRWMLDGGRSILLRKAAD